MKILKISQEIESNFGDEFLERTVHCPICNSLSLVSEVNDGNSRLYYCLRCGSLKISRSFLKSSEYLYGLDRHEKKKISSYLRGIFESSPEGCFFITTYNWEDLKKQALSVSITPLDKVNKLLVALNSILSFLGEKLYPITLELKGAFEEEKENIFEKLFDDLRKKENISKLDFSILHRISVYYFLEAMSYIDNSEEFHFVLNSLQKEDIINFDKFSGFSYDRGSSWRYKTGIIKGLTISLKGVEYIEKYLQEMPKASNKAFVAIQFKGFEQISNAICSAITSAGYEPVQANKVHYADFAMDWILNRISESKFIVAELSSENNGVYFEAGYALGKKIPLITCIRKSEKEDVFKKVHFDLRQYNTIVYNNEEELEKLLKERIINVVGKGPCNK